MEADPQLQRGVAQSPCEPGRVDDTAYLVPDAGAVGRRHHFGLHGVAVEVFGGARELPGFLPELLQLFDLVGLGRHQELTVLLESGIDRVALERSDEAPVVLPSQPLELCTGPRDLGSSDLDLMSRPLGQQTF